MKYKIYILLALLCFSCSNSNNSASISVSQPKDSTAIWIQTARNKSLSISKKNRILLLKKADKAINNYKDNSAKASSLSKLSLAFKRLGDSLSFREKNAQLIELSKKIKDYKSHGEAHWDLGSFFKLSQPDSSIYHYKEAYTLFLKADLDSISIAYPGNMLYSMALVKDNNKDYVGAEKDIVKAIQYFTDNTINNKLFSAYNCLAVTQNGLKKYDKAIEYHIKAKEYISFSRKNKKYNQYATNINNLASTNLRKGDYTKAIQFYKELLLINNLKQKDLELYAQALSGLAYAKFKINKTDKDSLLVEFDSSNHILDSINLVYYKARNYEYKAEVLKKQNKIELAIKNAAIAKDIAKETSNNDRLLSSLKLLTTIDKKNSAMHAKAYFKLTEELQVQERAIQDKFARIELETDEVIEENQTLSKQKKNLIGLAIVLLVIGLGTFIIIYQRANNQKLKFQQSQQESNQEIYNLMLSQQGKLQEGKQLEQKRVSEEMHDGILGQMLGIRLILSGLNERIDEAAITQRAELILKLQELEEEIRTISHELNNSANKKIDNFIIAVEDIIKTARSSSKLKILFEFTEIFDWDSMSGDLKINIYRIIQECIQNCIKHAKCEHITVYLRNEKNEVVLNVIDDGVGYNVKKGKKGIGLKNITSRIEKIDGKLEINSTLGKGTTMFFNIPLQNNFIKNKEELSILNTSNI